MSGAGESPSPRVCTYCGEEKPATLEFFSLQERGTDRLRSWCKKCRAELQLSQRKGTPKPPKRYEPPPLSEMKRCHVCGEKKLRTPEFWHQRKRSRDGLHERCKDCEQERGKDRYEADPSIIEKLKRWTKENPELFRTAKARWKAANPERVKQKNAEWATANRERLNMLNRAWVKANLEKVKEYSRRWGQKHPEKVAAASARRRARVASALGSHTASDLLAKLELQGGTCYYCPADLAVTGYHVDHKIPLNGGGTNWPANICCACPTCNLRKGSRSFWEFISNS